jgi:hypothetical protein
MTIQTGIPLFDRQQHHFSIPTKIIEAVARSTGPGRPQGRREAALPCTRVSAAAHSLCLGASALSSRSFASSWPCPADPSKEVRSGSRLCEKSNARRRRRMFFSTIVTRGGSMLLMHPEMQFRRIMFSTFCARATFHTAWVIRDRVPPAASSAMSAMPPIATDFCGAAKCRDVPEHKLGSRCAHSVTSSAWASSVGGTQRCPSSPPTTASPLRKRSSASNPAWYKTPLFTRCEAPDSRATQTQDGGPIGSSQSAPA